MAQLSRRLDKMERILAVQEKLHRYAEWKLARIAEAQAGLKSDERSLVEALNGNDPLQGLFVEAMAKRLAALAREAERVGLEHAAQTERLFAEALRLGRAERMAGRLRREHADELWKKSFGEIIDTAGRRKPDDASFP